MARWLYFVTLAKSEELAAFGHAEVIVELICSTHRYAYDYRNVSSANEIAAEAMIDRYTNAAGDIGYKHAHRYTVDLPEGFLERPQFSASCGCRAWYWRGC